MIQLMFMLFINKQKLIQIVRDQESLKTSFYQEILLDLENWNADYSQDKYEPTVFSLWDYYIILKSSSTNRSLMPLDYANWLIKAIKYLNKNVSNRKYAWKWHVLHTKSYPHFPFSNTSIKWFFMLKHPYGGSKNTIDTCLYYMSDFQKESFNWIHSSGLKLVIDMGNYTENKYSIDTGVSESLLSQFYFNMNPSFTNKTLTPLRYNNDSNIHETRPYTLYLISHEKLFNMSNINSYSINDTMSNH